MDAITQIEGGIRIASDAAAQVIVADHPDLDRESISIAMRRELWLAVTEAIHLARHGRAFHAQ